jgi:hypothetical protein
VSCFAFGQTFAVITLMAKTPRPVILQSARLSLRAEVG